MNLLTPLNMHLKKGSEKEFFLQTEGNILETWEGDNSIELEVIGSFLNIKSYRVTISFPTGLFSASQPSSDPYDTQQNF